MPWSAGAYAVAFGRARLTQGPSQGSQGGTITCKVPEVVVVEEDDPALPTAHVDAACICCELVARVRADPADDEELQDVLRVVLQAITGRPQDAAEVATLFQERFKSAGGGRRLLLGPPASQPEPGGDQGAEEADGDAAAPAGDASEPADDAGEPADDAAEPADDAAAPAAAKAARPEVSQLQQQGPAQPNSSPQASQVGHPTITLAIHTSKCLNSCIVVTATCPS